MTDKTVAVQAGDIIFYVENYKRLIHKSVGEINREKELYEEKYWQSDFVGTRYYAGLRAFEHASDYVLRQQKPGLVLLGEESGESESEESQEAVIEAACRKVRDEKQVEIEGLSQQLKQARAREQEMQGELVLRGQQLKTLGRRLEQAQSNYVILIGALALVIVVLLGILLL